MLREKNRLTKPETINCIMFHFMKHKKKQNLSTVRERKSVVAWFQE